MTYGPTPIVRFGYGPDDTDSPSIVGFTDYEEMIAIAEASCVRKLNDDLERKPYRIRLYSKTGIGTEPEWKPLGTVAGVWDEITGQAIVRWNDNRCNCESSYCKHDPAPCPNAAEGNWNMDLVGEVCDECAASIVESGGGRYVHPIHGRREAS